jgi:ABC-2 type transport system permease protein
MVVLFGAMIIFKVYPNRYILLSFVPLILLLVLSMGMGLILATLDVFFRDMEYLWGVVLMLIMYTSAIFYTIESIDAKWIFNFNPIYHIIVNFRNCIYGNPLDMGALLISSAYSGISLIIGVILFYRKQDKFILNI